MPFLSDDPKESKRVRILEDPFHRFETFSQFFRVVFRWQSPRPPVQKVRILKVAFHHFDTFSTFMSTVSFYLTIPKSHKSNAVRMLKDSFDHFDTFSQFSEEFSADNLQDLQVQKSGDPQVWFSPFWHFFNNYECSYFMWWSQRATSTTLWWFWRILLKFWHLLTIFGAVFSWQSRFPRKGGYLVMNAYHHLYPFSTFMSRVSIWWSPSATSPSQWGSFSQFQNFFSTIFQRSSQLTIPNKTLKSNKVWILRDPFHHFDTLSTFISAVSTWWSPRPQRWTKWGSSIIILHILTLVCHSWVQFLCDVLQHPHLQPSKDPQGSLSHCFTLFQRTPYLMIPRTPKSNPVSSILKVLFTFYDTFLPLFRAGRIWRSPTSQSSVKWGSSRILSPFWHFLC